jgi:hypothetical protein
LKIAWTVGYGCHYREGLLLEANGDRGIVMDFVSTRQISVNVI